MQTARRTYVVTAAVCVAAVGDVLTTWHGIESGSMYEANPVVRRQLSTGGYPLWLSVKTLGAILTLCLYGVTRRVAADGYEWAGYTAPALWILSHAAVTAHNGLMILSA